MIKYCILLNLSRGFLIIPEEMMLGETISLYYD